MKITKCITGLLAAVLVLTMVVNVDIIGKAKTEGSEGTQEAIKARYIIGDGEYDAENRRQTYQVYLEQEESSLYAGTFGLSYDASLDLSFELDIENFGYFQKYERGSNYIAFQWIYTKEIEEKEKLPEVRAVGASERIRLGTITIEKVEQSSSEPRHPQGWHKKTLRQLNWQTTPMSKEEKYTQNLGDMSLNEEIWRSVAEEAEEPEGTPSPTPEEAPEAPEEEEEGKKERVEGYYQGYNMIDEEQLEWIDIGFKWESGYELPEKEGKTIVGQVKSYNGKNPVRLTLYKKGTSEIAASMEQSVYTEEKADGRVTCSYGMEVSSAGEYTLEIRKDVHLTYRMEVRVPEGAEEVVVESVELYCGDISGDEKIKQNDRTVLLKYLNMQVYEETKEEARRSDLNGDGKVTNHDLNIFKTYYNKKYEEAE